MTSTLASVPPSVAALPFLLVRPQPDDPDWACRVALLAAAAAERADDRRRNTPGRIAYLLCEFGFQLARRGFDATAPFALGRRELAQTLGVSLSRVKRTLALLSLSGIVECDGASLKVLDWPRLCSAGFYLPRRLDLPEAEEPAVEFPTPAEAPPQLLTLAGEPACFV